MLESMVVKVGGSLYDLPDLGQRLRAWLDFQPTRQALLIPGGGAVVDLVRAADAAEGLGEERCHWLALQGLQFTGRLLAGRLRGGRVIDDLADCGKVWHHGLTPVLDMYAFARTDETRADHLPQIWSVTSDSLAARVARVAGICRLVLLKSCAMPPGCTWEEAARLGIIDAAFPNMLAQPGLDLQVSVVNLREWVCAAASAAIPRDRAP
jgi:aspartokinase-like uncharacterized kinase